MRNLVALMSVVLCLVGSGCGKSQSENCKKLIACAEALSPGSGAAMESSYGASGNCWKSGDAATACTSACDAAMTGYKAMPAFGTTAACK